MKLQFKEVKYLKYFRMCFFSYLDATKSKSLDFVCPSMSLSLRLHFDAIWVFLYYSYSSKIKSIWLETKFMQQSRVNNKYLIIRFNTLLLSHKTSRLAKNRTQVRTASKQHGRLNTDLISLFFSREAWVNIFISLYLRIK